ncbi:hypothetical protein C9439_04360 [archaeon SCG-AAA382B04]|nr:hypothetical protein C9439_04360 [archaeon SCG-AAA382B04]
MILVSGNMDFEEFREEVTEFKNGFNEEIEVAVNEEIRGIELDGGKVRVAASEVEGIEPVCLSNKYRIDAVLFDLKNGALLFREDNTFLQILDSEFNYTKTPLPVVEIESVDEEKITGKETRKE